MVHILRYLVEAETAPACIDQSLVRSSYSYWQNVYIKKSLELISSSNVRAYQPIVYNFKQHLQRRDFEIVDLSIKQRKHLGTKLPSAYRNVLIKRSEKTGDFVVKGFFYGAENIFAIDFAKDPHETLFTFAHEIVHAGDHRESESLKEIREMKPALKDLIYNLSGDQEVSGPWIESILKDLLFNNDGGSTALSFEFIYKRKIESFRRFSESNPQSKLKSLSNDEQKLLHDFIDKIMEISLMDEFRAYALSTAVYYQMASKINLPIHKNAEHYISLLQTGDGALAESIFLMNAVSPFDALQTSLRESIFNKTTGGIRPAKNYYSTYYKVLQVVNLLEEMYLTKVRKKIEELNREKPMNYLVLDQSFDFDESTAEASEAPVVVFSEIESIDYLAKKQSRLIDNNHVRDDLNNPFAVIGTRLSAGRLLRFRENLEIVSSKIREAISTIESLSMGIVDFHDLSRGEMELLGITGDSQIAKKFFDNMPLSFRKSKEQLPELMIDVMKKVKKQRGSFKSSLDTSKDYLLYDLLIVRLVKIYYWLDTIMPIYNQNMLGIKTYFEKLESDNYSKELFSNKELVSMYQHLISSQDLAIENYRNMEELKQSLYWFDRKWGLARQPGIASISNALLKLQSEIIGTFSLSTQQKLDIQLEVESLVKDRMNQYQDRKKIQLKRCQKQKERTYQDWVKWDTSYASFHTIDVCARGKFFKVRFINDIPFLFSVKSTSFNDRIEFKIFGDSEYLVFPLESSKVGHYE